MSAPILIVDDDADVRDMIALGLALDGFESVTAADGVEALEQLHRGLRPLVVLLDLRMPRLNGFELLAILKRDPALARIPIVVLTGDAAAGRSSRLSGAAGFLVKPFEASDVSAAVRRYDRPGRAAA